jgi:hypothetical protein
MKIPTLQLVRFLAAGAFVLALASSAFALQSPKSVSSALRVLNQVVGHTGRLIAAKDYDHVGGEHGEFTEGADMLREGLRGEPADFTAKVETALKAAVDASAALGKIAPAHDDAKLNAAHDDFAAKVKTVIELFPEDVRPKPRTPKKA